MVSLAGMFSSNLALVSSSWSHLAAETPTHRLQRGFTIRSRAQEPGRRDARRRRLLILLPLSFSLREQSKSTEFASRAEGTTAALEAKKGETMSGGPTITLTNAGHGGAGVSIPALGLGVYQVPPREALRCVAHALQNGYRHIDTAHLYGNEAEVGRAVRESGVPREEVFVTTKLWNSDHGYENALSAFDRSLRALGLDYVDLYLIHSPMPVRQRLQTWRAMEQILRSGRARSIGVSNYGVQHLQELFANCEIRPSVNQLELHPFNTRSDLVEFCQKEGVVLEAYSPLTRGERLRHPGLLQIAKTYKKTAAQVLIKWCLQKGFVVLPKSVTPKRIVENAEVFDFEIRKSDMAKLDSFDEYLVVGWDPTTGP